MPSFKYGRTIFIHNGDYSGNVEILNEGLSIVISFDDIKAFVAEYMRSNRIRFLENAADDEILGIKLVHGQKTTT